MRKSSESKKHRAKTRRQIRKTLRRMTLIPGEILADILELPEDAMTGGMRVTLIGQGTVWVEHYQSILEYKEGVLLLQGKQYRLRIEGAALRIEYYTADDLLLKGKIRCVGYES